MTLHVAGPLLSEADAWNFLRKHARARNMSGTGGLHVVRGFQGWHVYEHV